MGARPSGRQQRSRIVRSDDRHHDGSGGSAPSPPRTIASPENEPHRCRSPFFVPGAPLLPLPPYRNTSQYRRERAIPRVHRNHSSSRSWCAPCAHAVALVILIRHSFRRLRDNPTDHASIYEGAFGIDLRFLHTGLPST